MSEQLLENREQVAKVKEMVEKKCVLLAKEVISYNNFELAERPDEDLRGLLAKVAVLRKKQDRVSSIRLDALVLGDKVVARAKAFSRLLEEKTRKVLVGLEASLSASGQKTNKEQRQAMVEEKLAEDVKVKDLLQDCQDSLSSLMDVVKEVDGNLRSAGIMLSNQINVVSCMTRLGEIKVEAVNGKAAL